MYVVVLAGDCVLTGSTLVFASLLSGTVGSCWLVDICCRCARTCNEGQLYFLVQTRSLPCLDTDLKTRCVQVAGLSQV